MKFKKLSLVLLCSVMSLSVLAHEGHNHDAPKTLLPLKGGTIKPFNIESKDGKKDATCFVEVVKSKKDLKIYFFNTDQKPIEAKEFELVATAEPFDSNKSTMESKGKAKSNAQLLPIQDKEKFYLTSYDKKNAHKYDLLLKFKNSSICKADEEIKFVID